MLRICIYEGLNFKSGYLCEVSYALNVKNCDFNARDVSKVNKITYCLLSMLSIFIIKYITSQR
jgi:hypothetical protein